MENTDCCLCKYSVFFSLKMAKKYIYRKIHWHSYSHTYAQVWYTSHAEFLQKLLRKWREKKNVVASRELFLFGTTKECDAILQFSGHFDKCMLTWVWSMPVSWCAHQSNMERRMRNYFEMCWISVKESKGNVCVCMNISSLF